MTTKRNRNQDAYPAPYYRRLMREYKNTVPEAVREKVAAWIAEHITPARQINKQYNGYLLRMDLVYGLGVALLTEQFYGAMLLSGYEPVDPDETVWRYRVNYIK